MDEHVEINKAKKELEKISNNAHERYLAELREKYILDQKATESVGYVKGKKDGKKEGLTEGLTKGKAEAINLVAKKLLEQGIAIEVISQATGLKKEEIEKLQQ